MHDISSCCSIITDVWDIKAAGRINTSFLFLPLSGSAQVLPPGSSDGNVASHAQQVSLEAPAPGVG